MGMEQGMTEAMSQMDAVLADLASFAAGNGTTTQILSDTQVRITRIIRGEVQTVWRATRTRPVAADGCSDPTAGPMPVCEVRDRGRPDLPV